MVLNTRFRPCPHVGNFNLAIWRQRDKEMFFCKKKLPTQKNVQHSSAIFFSHRCQQCSHNLRLPDCFQKFYTIFFTKNLSGTWVLTYNSSDGKIAKEKLQTGDKKNCWEFMAKSPNGKIVKSLYLKIAYVWTRPKYVQKFGESKLTLHWPNENKLSNRTAWHIGNLGDQKSVKS